MPDRRRPTPDPSPEPAIRYAPWVPFRGGAQSAARRRRHLPPRRVGCCRSRKAGDATDAHGWTNGGRDAHAPPPPCRGQLPPSPSGWGVRVAHDAGTYGSRLGFVSYDARFFYAPPARGGRPRVATRPRVQQGGHRAVGECAWPPVGSPPLSTPSPPPFIPPPVNVRNWIDISPCLRDGLHIRLATKRARMSALAVEEPPPGADATSAVTPCGHALRPRLASAAAGRDFWAVVNRRGASRADNGGRGGWRGGGEYIFDWGRRRDWV